MLEFVAETGSTSSDLLARLAGGETLREGDWLIADRQLSGRGRQGRSWFDGSGNFMGSSAVHLRGNDPPPASLALAAGLALHRVVEPLIPPPRQALLKWPNDLLVAGAKIAGILLERGGDTVIVGIGVNLRRAPDVPGRMTGALADLTAAPDRDAFAALLAAALNEEVQLWRSAGIAALIGRWTQAAHPIGTPLAAEVPGEGPVEGTFAGLDDAGHLRLKLADGTTQTIHAGDVSLRGGH